MRMWTDFLIPYWYQYSSSAATTTYFKWVTTFLDHR